jgi:hypothetical protein
MLGDTTRNQAQRAEDAAALLADFHHPQHVAARISWIIDGSYGFGCAHAAHEILLSPHMNRPAALCNIFAAYDHDSTQHAARKAWHQLTKKAQTALTNAVQKEIDYHLAAAAARDFETQLQANQEG